MIRTENLLCLTITRRCDRRCGWCPQEFVDRDMSESTLDAALEGLLPRLSAPRRLKLSGGEPLLRPDLVARALDRAAELSPDTRVELHTHGGGLSTAAAVLARHPRTELFVSRLLPAAARYPRAAHVFLLTPEESPARTVVRFLDAAAMGFTRFVLMPSYYVAWTPAALSCLGARLAAVGLARVTLAERGLRTEILNSSGFASTPLYDEGLVVDADGEVYASSLALTAAADGRRDALRLGNVSAPSLLAQFPEVEAPGVLAQSFPAEIVSATMAADVALRTFSRTIECGAV